MHITITRPAVQGCCAQHSLSRTTERPADAFVSGYNAEALDDLNGLAALARSVKQNAAKAQLPADLVAVVETQLGEAGIVNIKDERVGLLYRFFVQGVETPAFDPLQTLGEGWELQDNAHPSRGGPVTFSRYGDSVTQHLSFEQKQGTTLLHTIHNESFISTRHYAITEERDGKIVVDDQIVS